MLFFVKLSIKNKKLSSDKNLDFKRSYINDALHKKMISLEKYNEQIDTQEQRIFSIIKG